MKKINKTRQTLTEEFLKILDEPTGFWDKPWYSYNPERQNSKMEYKGINKVLLSLISDKQGYKDNRWFTVTQLKSLNEKRKEGEPFIHVKKGEKATSVEYWKAFMSKNAFKTEQEFVNAVTKANAVIGRSPTTRNGTYNTSFTPAQVGKIRQQVKFDHDPFYLSAFYSNVFNAEQIENMPKLIRKEFTTNFDKIQIAEEVATRYLKNENIKLENNLNRCYYSMNDDRISTPPKESFKSQEDYISSLLHEISHSTGAKNRLNRDMVGLKTNDLYAIEELRAEIGSVILCSELGVSLSKDHIENHKAYVQNWQMGISNEKSGEKILMDAIKDAEKIADFVKEKGQYKEIMLEHGIDIDQEQEYEEVESKEDISSQENNKEEIQEEDLEI